MISLGMRQQVTQLKKQAKTKLRGHDTSDSLRSQNVGTAFIWLTENLNYAKKVKISRINEQHLYKR